MGPRSARAWVAGALLPLAACALTVDVDMDMDGDALGIHGNGVIGTESRDAAGYDRVSIRSSVHLGLAEDVGLMPSEEVEVVVALSAAARLETSGDVDRLTLTRGPVAWAGGVTFIRHIGDPALEIHVSGKAWIGRY